eukprot:CAMPEP_0185740190 /NCGR_PEP_ID=MMETSP1171-20130828/37253_1 /TAXON_ID=374046 /ORGANISM="Helicotheca tamensis, Strain CCMP826" /LENGTH=37 /DNA_ID= /DNA_START= /DNA_END= /DNA_ORIENTATION=
MNEESAYHHSDDDGPNRWKKNKCKEYIPKQKSVHRKH